MPCTISQVRALLKNGCKAYAILPVADAKGSQFTVEISTIKDGYIQTTFGQTHPINAVISFSN